MMEKSREEGEGRLSSSTREAWFGDDDGVNGRKREIWKNLISLHKSGLDI